MQVGERRFRGAYLVLVVACAGVFLAGALTWFVRHDRGGDEASAPVDEPRALAPAPSAVSLTVSAPNGLAVRGMPVATVAEAFGEVQRLELWDGGAMVGAVPVTGDRGRAEIPWTPLRQGPHLLQARAVGADGETALSAPVSVGVRAPTVGSDAVVVPVVAGTDAASVAALAGVDPAVVQPGPTTEGGATTFEVPTEVLDAPGSVVDPSDPPSGAPPEADGEGAPSLAAAVDGCTVTVTVAGVSGKASIYEASGTGGGSVLVAEVDGSGEVVLEDLGPGAHVFSLAVGDQPVVGAPASATLGADCTPSWWEGDATLIDGVVTIPEAAPDLYLYVSVDDQPAFRVPESPGTFLPSSTQLDVSGLLPHLSGSVVRLEVWSGTEPATRVASGTATLPDGVSATDLVGESTKTVLASEVTEVKPNADEVAFRWATGTAQATGIWWQVLAAPVSSRDQGLEPLGLIATGIAPVGAIPDGLMAGPAKGGTFTIAPSVLLGAANAKASAGGGSGGGGSGGGGSGAVGGLGLIEPGGVTLGHITGEDDAATSNPDGVPIVPSNRVFVRVLPMRGGQPLGAASQIVGLDRPAPTQPPTAVFDLDEATLRGGRAGNPALAGCVRVSQVPWTVEQAQSGLIFTDAPASWTFVAPFYPTPGTYCWGDFDHSPPDDDCDWGVLCDVVSTVGGWIEAGIGALTDALGPVWDYIAKAYNGLIDLAATVVSKLNPACLAAGAAAELSGSETLDDVQSTCEQVSKVAAKAGIAAVLAFYGLPPSLPTSDQLAALADGRLEDFAVEVLKDLGVPCDDLVVSPDQAQAAQTAGIDVPDEGYDVCRAFTRAVLDEVEQQARFQAQQTVAQVSGLPGPALPIDGFAMALEPRQFPAAPSLFVSATPQSADTPSDAVCPVSFDLTGPEQPVGSVVAAWDLPTVGSWELDLDPFGSGVGSGPSIEVERSWAALLRIPVSAPPSVAHPLHGQLSSADCLTGTPTTIYGTVDPPLGRWSPGQAG